MLSKQSSKFWQDIAGSFESYIYLLKKKRKLGSLFYRVKVNALGRFFFYGSR